MLTSNVIYKFDCASCSACYIGETERHFFRRMQEHLGLIKGASPTAVTKHLAASANCKANNAASSFSIIDNEASMFKRRIMEALYIRDFDPIVNRQIKSYKLQLIQWFAIVLSYYAYGWLELILDCSIIYYEMLLPMLVKICFIISRIVLKMSNV